MVRDPEAFFAGVATGAAGLFAGGALNVSAVQHPALMRCPSSSGFRLGYFGVMFRLAAPLQASLATLSGVAAVTAGLLQRERGIVALRDPGVKDRQTTLWLTSGVTMVAIVPYTLLAMMKLNRQLMDTTACLQHGDAWVDAQLARWARLHSVRTGASLLAFTAMVVALSGEGSRKHRR